MSGEEDSITIKFQPSLTIENVSGFYEELFEVKDKEVSKVIFDCSVNEEIDFAAIQTLTAFYKHMVGKGAKVSWDNPSIALFEKTVELGMDEALGL